MRLTQHLISQVCPRLGITPDDIIKILKNPDCVYKSHSHPGQLRMCGNGICLVIGEDKQTVITAYKDRVLTPLRQDQAGVTIHRKKFQNE